MNENVVAEGTIVSEEIVKPTGEKIKEMFKKNGKKIAVIAVAVIGITGLVLAGLAKGKNEVSDDECTDEYNEDDSSEDEN